MDKMRMKSSSNDSSRSARSTKSASASRSSLSISKTIVRNFMKGLMTTEELMKKKKYKNKGIVRLRVVLSPVNINKGFNPKMLINKEFDGVVKGLKNTNNKLLKI
jgi:hypothetical protein